MKTLSQWFDLYGVSHQDPRNRAIHKICVPLIFFSVVGLLLLGQFVGHKIEGKKPSFFEDLQFLLIGPLWVLRGIVFK